VCQRSRDEADRGVVIRALRFRDDQEPVDQLDAIVGHEDALRDELLVLRPRPSFELEVGFHHPPFAATDSRHARCGPSMPRKVDSGRTMTSVVTGYEQ
jgi:hypothetical protein